MKLRQCPLCDAKTLVDRKHRDRTKVNNLVYETQLPMQHCTSCGEGFFAGGVLARAEQEAALWFLTQGPPTPAVLQFARKAMGLPATELATLMGVAPETISRWENGKMKPTRATVAVLAFLVADELAGTHAMRERLEALAKAS